MLKNFIMRFRETVDPTPVAKPLNLRIPSQTERILALVRHEQAMAAQRGEFETFEEGDDFELDDGEEWSSPYEEIFEPDPVVPPPAAPAAAPTPEPKAE